MKKKFFIIAAILISFNCHAMEEKITKYFQTDSTGSCTECSLGDEAKLQKFPILEDTCHWIILVNMLTPFRCSLYLLTKRHVTSFTELTVEELEEYRELLNKWKSVMSQETTLETFNTGWEEYPSKHLCIECAVRSPSDNGAINMLLEDTAVTRNPQILYKKLLKIALPSSSECSLPEIHEEFAQLASCQFFQEKEHNLHVKHYYDSSSRETHAVDYAPIKKEPIGCFFCKDIHGDFEGPKSSLVFKGALSSALISIGSYANGHLLYCPHAHVTKFEELSREQAMDFLATNQKCISVLQHKQEELLEGGALISTQSFIQEGVGSGATVPQHLHGQTLLKDTKPAGIVATFYNPKKTIRDLAKIRTILREGFRKLKD